MKRPFPKAAIILLIVLGLRFSALSADLSSFQWAEGVSSSSSSSQWYNEYYTPFSNGISNATAILMNGGVGPWIGPSIKSLSDSVVASTSRIRSNNNNDNKSTIRQRRILLGISTKDYLDKAERQHRRIIRDTWLQQNFHDDSSDGGGESSSLSSHKVCSLHQMLKSTTVDDCQLVYTFLFPNKDNQTSNLEELLDVYRNYRDDDNKRQDDDPSSSLATTRIQESKHDAFFVSVDNPKNHYEVLLQWSRLVVQLLSSNNNNARSIVGSFDYVGFATTQAMVFPKPFWKKNNEIFQSTLPHESMVAGMPKDGDEPNEDFKTQCSESFCLDPNFLCFSQDVVHHLASTTTTGRVLLDSAKDGQSMDAASLASSQLFQHFQEYKQKTGSGISWKQLYGVQRADKSPERVISAWDKYVATITDYQQHRLSKENIPLSQEEEYPHAPVTTYQGNPRMLVGIFTTNLKPIERKRRNALRQTFIKSYDHTPTPHRICSLQELLKKQVSEEDCQLAYTFVIGAGNKKKKATPMVNVNANNTKDMVIPSSQITDPEPDVLYLNIKENMNDGKSETWFKYATLLSESQLYFDYITKMDTDTLLFPYPLFEKMSQWPKYPNNIHIYGGHYVVKQDAVQRAGLTVLGTSYMDGPMYWLSPDVARFISDPNRCNHTELRTHAEDMSIGNYVNSFPYPIHRLTLSNKCYAHPLKRLEHYRKRWKRYKKKFKKYHP
mmetsp:Transcript_32681/g.79261  ORF Transcript_32681/g.79261 Transcript_32681/m.79261 type:complete len:721 (-) Transcript_32681:1019-3181(-)|eukprot:CAMPEP_0113610920 /NCGR_PEP_ID=MMETSP0017_2-20120614/5282_1 /TAXON_ID=2856 /ORGANISM="Cylindrotheca closterium" /LENGTH=720 /DNA_ID=CAMNT_0000519837 /DNA_START=38 /DNA_END=2200 /DNA_ORIENTATION=+ /assembly_acc=CAM_ASM_000147